MKDLIDKINSTFLQRTSDLSAQKEIWEQIAIQFRPEINQYRTARPSALLARETGLVERNLDITHGFQPGS